MKPEHFGKIKPAGSCALCVHQHYIGDLQKSVCVNHCFTLPYPSANYVCEDFADPRTQPGRIPLLDVLELPFTPEMPKKPITLVIENAWIESASITDVRSSTPDKIHGKLEGYINNTSYTIKFQATDIMVEEL